METAKTDERWSPLAVLGALRDAFRGARIDYTQGSLRRALLLLAVPIVLELSMEGGFSLADVFFVARLGPDALASVGLTESVVAVIAAAETGHLIIGTMHASTAYQALDRILTQAGPDMHIISQMLASNRLCSVAQNLIPARESTEQNPQRVLCLSVMT